MVLYRQASFLRHKELLMTDIPQPKSIEDIPDIAPIKPEEVIDAPFKESLIEVAQTQKEVKTMYQRAVEKHAENAARLKAHIKSSKEAEDADRNFILFKIQNMKDMIDENTEALHYAQQDYDALVMKADLSGKAAAAKEVCNRLERDIASFKRELSELERSL